ncbi:hypothetical protein SCHPADRAFT_629825 [Schizopora paradoxa]|uniref:Zn(2)-C6 fungal-type domain-containing protein n=1 Tax=Schizopora paradoxa TaxID=27342 RepID=A0A0H2R7N9_9AGAM|nr:hypothetical protein SCHPADRAFT_629825 [Schizopora paradoxa]
MSTFVPFVGVTSFKDKDTGMPLAICDKGTRNWKRNMLPCLECSKRRIRCTWIDAPVGEKTRASLCVACAKRGLTECTPRIHRTPRVKMKRIIEERSKLLPNKLQSTSQQSLKCFGDVAEHSVTKPQYGGHANSTENNHTQGFGLTPNSIQISHSFAFPHFTGVAHTAPASIIPTQGFQSSSQLDLLSIDGARFMPSLGASTVEDQFLSGFQDDFAVAWNTSPLPLSMGFEQTVDSTSNDEHLNAM